MSERILSDALKGLDMSSIGMSSHNVTSKAKTVEGVQEMYDNITINYPNLGGLMMHLENDVIPLMTTDPDAADAVMSGARLALMILAEYAAIEDMHQAFPDAPILPS